MSNDLESRLSYEAYLGDPLVRVGVSGRVGQQESEAWVPERLFLRLLAYGNAYALHNLQLVVAHGDSGLNSLQCQGLLRELDLLFNVAKDPALQFALCSVREVAELVARNASLTLEFSPN